MTTPASENSARTPQGRARSVQQSRTGEAFAAAWSEMLGLDG